jgi:hypothetical protein
LVSPPPIWSSIAGPPHPHEAAPLEAKGAQEQLGPAASVIPLDIIDQHAVRTAFPDIKRIDHLVTVAAETLRGRLVDLDTHRARQLFEVKFGRPHH